jgi:hypothetical protein
MAKILDDTSQPAPSRLADRIIQAFRGWGGGDSLDRRELDRVAAEFGMSGRALEELSSHGPQAADLLYDRMTVLNVTTADADRLAQGLMRDLQVTCTRCDNKQACRRDLAQRPTDETWKDYCPNSAALTAVGSARGRFPA